MVSNLSIIIFCILLLLIYKCLNNSYNDDFYSLVNNENLPILDNYNIIPNNLFQIYIVYKNPIPQYIFDSINKYASNYTYYLYNDNDAKIFLLKYFDKKVFKRFKSLNQGAHKADLLRYCLLYVYGGVYIDIKTILIKSLDVIFKDKSCFYTCISSISNNSMCNGLLASKARNPLFLKLINNILNTNDFDIKRNFVIFCDYLNKIIQDDLIYDKTQGLNMGKTQNYYLFQEVCNNKTDLECTKLDRYGHCCSMYDKGEKVFITRDPNFPW